MYQGPHSIVIGKATNRTELSHVNTQILLRSTAFQAAGNRPSGVVRNVVQFQVEKRTSTHMDMTKVTDRVVARIDPTNNLWPLNDLAVTKTPMCCVYFE
jgi:hypothetical protein